MPVLLDRARAIFLHAVGKLPESQWEEYVQRATDGDVELAQQVRGMLQVHCEAGSFLELPAAQLLGGPAAALGENLAKCDQDRLENLAIGPFKLLEQIGEGGFGVVYLAEQQSPVRRKVALKILKPGMDTRQVVARFEAERQALAIMDHPNIAKVFDGGATASGRPYFVMELVKGAPITEFCDQHNLPLSDRLRLFVAVCQAVQHAHQKGVIHRDLKPSNILVSRHDTTPVVKVIDFGVAKAIAGHLTDKTVFTGMVQMIGTPMYMSPEQAGLSDLDIDTRSDIYSLGVLLYELLTGATPFLRERFQNAAFDEIRLILRDEEPPKPSCRLSSMDIQPASAGLARRETQSATTTAPALAPGDCDRLSLEYVAARRGAEPARLTRLLRGELDWIVMKALEKDRNRRYETAVEFADDVQRYLADQPVAACPPSRVYRFGKFARRHRKALAAGVLAAAALSSAVVALAATTWLVSAERNAARHAAQRARQESAKAELERRRADENFIQARKVVDDLVTNVAWKLENIPGAEGVRRRLLLDAQAYYEEFLRQSSNDPTVRFETALAYLRVGAIHQQLGDRTASEEALLQSSRMLRQLHDEFPESPSYHEHFVECYSYLAQLKKETGETKQALDYGRQQFRHSLLLIQSHPGVARFRWTAIASGASLGHLLGDAYRIDEAENVFQQAFAVLESVRADFPSERENLGQVSYLHWSYGAALTRALRFDEAEKHLRQAIALHKSLEPSHDTYFHTARSDLARLLNKTGRPAEALENLRYARSVLEKRSHGALMSVMERRQWGRCQEEYGLTLFATGDAAGAEQSLRMSLESRRELLASHDNMGERSNLAWSHYHLGELLWETGRRDAASEQFSQALGLFEENGRRYPEQHPVCYHLAWLLAACPDPAIRNPQRSQELIARALALAPERGVYWTCQGIAHYRRDDWQAAIQSLQDGVALRPDCDGFEWFYIAMAQQRLGQHQQAAASYARGVEWLKQHPVGELELRACRREAAALLGIDDPDLAPASG